MKNLLKRSLTGVIYVALIVAAVLAGGWWFVSLFALFAILAINEFANLTIAKSGGENVITLISDMAGTLILFVGLSCVNIGLLTPHTTAVLGGTFFIKIGRAHV